MTSALGVTGEQRDDQISTYSNNGLVSTLADAKGNVTTYEYDGFDRILKTRYPSPTTAGSSSATDYEQTTYDQTNNVVSRRLRDGQTIAYGYDNLDRLVFKDVPNTAPGEYDVTYAYDNLGRLTQARMQRQNRQLSIRCPQPQGQRTEQLDNSHLAVRSGGTYHPADVGRRLLRHL